MSRWVDFSCNAPVYDRRHGSLLSEGVASQLAAIAALEPGARLLDIGAGTGRVAIPFANLGCRVVALDPSNAMLHELMTKQASRGSACGPSEPRGLPSRRVRASGGGAPRAVRTVAPVAGEGGRLPFPDRTFNAVVLARVLYLTRDWRDLLTEAARVLDASGVVFHEWGNGSPEEEWVQIRERLRILFEEAGVGSPFHPGARTEAEVRDLAGRLGLSLQGEWRTAGEVRLTLAEFLARIADNEYSYTWSVPIERQRPCLRELEEWAGEHFDLSRQIPLPRDMIWHVYKKTAPI